jgi:hypothetical protein
MNAKPLNWGCTKDGVRSQLYNLTPEEIAIIEGQAKGGNGE